MTSQPQIWAFAPDVPMLIYFVGTYGRGGLALRVLRCSWQPQQKWLSCTGTVAIISAGTSDEHVAEECRATADVMGCYCFRLADVSVDGLHRILHNLPGQLHVSCTSQAAETPNAESQHSPCKDRLDSRDGCACTDADPSPAQVLPSAVQVTSWIAPRMLSEGVVSCCSCEGCGRYCCGGGHGWRAAGCGGGAGGGAGHCCAHLRGLRGSPAGALPV